MITTMTGEAKGIVGKLPEAVEWEHRLGSPRSVQYTMAVGKPVIATVEYFVNFPEESRDDGTTSDETNGG